MKYQEQEIQKKLLLSFFYLILRVTKIKKIFNKIKIKQLRSNPTFFFKFQSRNKKFLNSFIKKKKNTKLFKNFLLLDFYKKTQNISNVDRKSTRLNSSHVRISYAVFCLK